SGTAVAGNARRWGRLARLGRARGEASPPLMRCANLLALARERWQRSRPRRRDIMGPKPNEIRPAEGKLGVLLPGMGAVATTFVGGVMAIKKGLAKPIGSLTQMGTIRLGKRTDNRSPMVKDFVPLANLDQLEFAGL